MKVHRRKHKTNTTVLQQKLNLHTSNKLQLVCFNPYNGVMFKISPIYCQWIMQKTSQLQCLSRAISHILLPCETKSSATSQEPHKHAVSWNLVNYWKLFSKYWHWYWQNTPPYYGILSAYAYATTHYDLSAYQRIVLLHPVWKLVKWPHTFGSFSHNKVNTSLHMANSCT